MKPKLTRAEFMFPQITHKNKYNLIRQLPLPAALKSTLFKLSNDILLTEERLFNSGHREDRKCRLCNRVDNLGHYLLCVKSLLYIVNDYVIGLYRESNPGIAMEAIIHSDLSCDKEQAYSLLWILAMITEFTFKYKKEVKPMKIRDLRATFNTNLQALNKLASGTTYYNKTIKDVSATITLCS